MFAVLLTAWKNFSIGMHLNIYESIWFKLSMMIGTIDLYILILVFLTLTFIQGHRSARKQKFLGNYLTKIFNEFGWKVVI